ncbi:TnsA endonuclease N-terminal domain-containing protein [Photobacterium sp. BZF1]|uniref:TnsA endonuclease N-terminal domain-containing protein n=1 Tax=Photobacterium sp. BZF1 TaxID=1904457 RepID=UPI0016536A3D|nr:TnsA endonuclease N-terminal domain-containing protein [Photobacterium sp. BZF1]MBC7006617.1 TnsA endonuclease N-terminal domain-containing protein [Photobacterium sp. BZF1]
MRSIKRHSRVSNIYRIKSLKAGVTFKLESLGEVCQALINELDINVISQCAQPFTIKYWFNGKQHHYTPDFLVKMANGEWRVIEVKPKNHVKPFKEKFDVIRLILKKKGSRS